MSRRDRSRSPRGGGGGSAGEWISRTIVGFGRYPHKRPPHLFVDSTGTMTLKALMDTWARGQGLSEKDVRKAVYDHMFDKNGGSHIRFSLNEDGAGNTTIRVLPKRGGGGPVATPARNHWEPQRHSWSSEVKKEQEEEAAPKQPEDRGSKARDDWESKEASDWESKERSRGSRRWDSGPWDSRERNDWESKDKRDWEANPRQRSSQWHSGSGQGPSRRGSGEAVQRWIAWVLANGHRDVGVRLQDAGRARLCDLAWALGRSKPDFGITSEAALRDLLEETDLAGRFKVDSEGCVHKVHRDDRRPRTAPRSGGQPAAPLAPEGPPGGFWQKFTDNGTFWWYYEGPMGKWWCTDTEKKIMPMQED